MVHSAAPAALTVVLLAGCSAPADAAPADAEYVTVEPGTGFAALLEDAKLVNNGGCLMFELPADSVVVEKRFTAAFSSTARMEGDTVRTDGGLSLTVGEVANVGGGMLPDDPLGIDVTVPDVCAGTAPIWSVSA